MFYTISDVNTEIVNFLKLYRHLDYLSTLTFSQNDNLFQWKGLLYLVYVTTATSESLVAVKLYNYYISLARGFKFSCASPPPSISVSICRFIGKAGLGLKRTKEEVFCYVNELNQSFLKVMTTI